MDIFSDKKRLGELLCIALTRKTVKCYTLARRTVNPAWRFLLQEKKMNVEIDKMYWKIHLIIGLKYFLFSNEYKTKALGNNNNWEREKEEASHVRYNIRDLKGDTLWDHWFLRVIRKYGTFEK